MAGYTNRRAAAPGKSSLNIERRIEETILQYGDDVIAWEVVNEAINDNPRDPEMWRVRLPSLLWVRLLITKYK